MSEITIKDIARICGVSVSTVSRALNNQSDINKATRESILKVVKENNYTPNNSARSLKIVDSKAIAVLVKGVNNPFLNDMISVMEVEIQKRGYSFILQRVEEKENEQDVAARIVKEKRISGIIFLGGIASPTKNKLDMINVPFVLSTVGYHGDEKLKLSSVSIDDEKESYKMVDYLCKKGHKNIAILSAERDDESIGALRLLGYKTALMDNNISVNEKLIIHMECTDGYSMCTGYDMTKRLIESGEEFSCIYAISDSLAVGAMRAVYEQGFKVPEDIAVAGFDGIEIGGFYTPTLTTIKQPVEKMAFETVEIIFNLVEGKGNKQVFFDGELLERESTSARR